MLGRKVRFGERKFYLFIEGISEEFVKVVKGEFMCVVNDIIS